MDRSNIASTTREPHKSLADGARTLIALVRPEYIPTVFSNCLAGWWLGGAGNVEQLTVVLTGALLVFLGGAFLNDAFDVGYDRQHRRQRPVPAGRIGLRIVWRCGLVLLLLGTSGLQWPGRLTGGLALALALSVVLHNSMHRLLPFSPAFRGFCRLFLYLLGASVANRGLTGISIWCGLAMALYVTGLESLHSDPEHKARRWLQVVSLAAPLILAFFLNAGPYLPFTAGLSLLLVLWAVAAWRVLERPADKQPAPNLFICGICLVDMLAACPAPLSAFGVPQSAQQHLCILFGGFFCASVLLTAAQSFVYRRSPQVSRVQNPPHQPVLFGTD